jgi:hypothetical protein
MATPPLAGRFLLYFTMEYGEHFKLPCKPVTYSLIMLFNLYFASDEQQRL